MSAFNVKVGGRVSRILPRNGGLAVAECGPGPVSLDNGAPSPVGGSMTCAGEPVQTFEQILEKTRREAFDAGFAEGRDSMRAEVKDAVEDCAVKFAGLAQSIKEQYERHLDQLDEPLLKLALAVAGKVIGRELQPDGERDDMLARQIQRMLKTVSGQSRAVVRINPGQMESISQQEVVNILNNADGTKISFVADDRLEPGECILETEGFVIEGLISRCLDDIGAELSRGETA